MLNTRNTGLIPSIDVRAADLTRGDTPAGASRKTDTDTRETKGGGRDHATDIIIVGLAATAGTATTKNAEENVPLPAHHDQRVDHQNCTVQNTDAQEVTGAALTIL